MRKILLRNFQSPGDIVMLTAAVRDLHMAHPGKFTTDVRTACGGLWENNPYLTPLADDDPELEVIDCEYPLIHKSNDRPVHFIQGFVENLEQQLGVTIKPGAFKGDIHISALEKGWMSQVQEITRQRVPFWIIVAGGKTDFTIKWWHAKRWQQVVNHFRGRVLFVQVGEKHHCHPQLEGVLDLRGKTDLRQLVRLVYHAQGVVCPVTLVMHLAAAVEVKGGYPKNRPCVVVAGGREPMQWEAYPHHQFIHTNGALPCCDQGGCWKSRTVPLGDGDAKDENLCVDVVEARGNGESPPVPLPRCMDLITAVEVIRRIQLYFDGGVAEFLTSRQAGCTQNAVEEHTRIRETQRIAARRARDGKGVVFLTVSDANSFPGTVATINSVLRFHSGGRLCVVNNHIDNPGLAPGQRALFEEQGVAVVDAARLAKRGRTLTAWELKAYGAADLTNGDEVLVGIDSDCVLCGPIDDVILHARNSGCFAGGDDGWSEDERTSRGYDIAVPVRNNRRISASLYVCSLDEQNRSILNKWAEGCDAAMFGQSSTMHPAYRDQAVLNAVLLAERAGDGVHLLDNRLWCQRGCYGEEPMRIEAGRLFNVAANARQRALHCKAEDTFWSREHLERVKSSGSCALNYAWFLALLWFGRCRVGFEHLDAAHTHLCEGLARHRQQVLELAAQLEERGGATVSISRR